MISADSAEYLASTIAFSGDLRLQINLTQRAEDPITLKYSHSQHQNICNVANGRVLSNIVIYIG